MVPVYRYWPTKPAVEGAHCFSPIRTGLPHFSSARSRGPRRAEYCSGRRPCHAGRTWAAPWPPNQNAWSELPSATYWPFLVLMDQTVPYVAGASSESLNFEAGENVLLKLEPTARFTKFLVTGPDPTTKPRLVPSPSNEFLEVIEPPELGIWSVKATGADNRTTMMGFSVNVPDRTGRRANLTRSTPQDLDTIFGKGNYKLAEDVQTMENVGQIARLGHEIFPLLMFLILIIVTLENFLANTFYKQAPQGKARQ